MHVGGNMFWSVPREHLAQRLLLIAALPLTFRTFQYFPGVSYVQEAWFVACFFAVIFIYPFWKLQAGLRFTWFEFYIFLLMFADVVLAAWEARQAFGQPFIYSVLAQRRMAVVAAWLLLVVAMRNRTIELADVEAALLFLAWATFVLFSTMRLLLNPANVNPDDVGFVTHAMPGFQPSFKLQSYLPLFGVFYYAILGMKTRRLWYYFLATVLFLPVVGPTGRGLTIAVIAVLFYALYRMRGFRRTIISSVQFSCLLLVLGGVLYLLFPKAVSERVAGFGDAFTVIFTGTAATQDVSANARVTETLTALPYIADHPLLGSGVISNQWEGGVQAVMNHYFYADDIGVVGVIFSYGIFGLLLYLLQYRFAWIEVRRLGNISSPVLDATKAFIMFTVLSSLETGLFVWQAEVSLFFVAVLVGTASQRPLPQSSGIVIETSCSLPRPALSS
jgi:hypothetical protein